MNVFCTHCGTKLPEDALFCTNCGVPTGAPANRTSEDVTAALDSLATDPVAIPVTPAYVKQYAPGNTNPFDQLQEAAVGGSAQRRGLPTAAIAAIAFAATLLVVGLLYLFVFSPRPGSSTNAPASTATAASEAAPASAASPASTAPTAQPMTDAEVRAALMPYFEGMDGYNSEVAACATDFNGYLTNSSYDIRSAYAETARSLSGRIHADYDVLAAIDVPASSAHHQAYSDMLICYDDLCHRIDVIVECWDISLSYSDASGHGDEITAPLERDREGSDNKYYADYNNRVGSISL